MQDTGVKAFACKDCQRSFSRKDSLARHEKLHSRRRPATHAASPLDLAQKPATPESIRSSIELNESTVASAVNGSDEPHSNTTSLSTPPIPPPSAGQSQSLDLDFDLIWPDSEDLFQTIMSTDSASQWQMPLGSLPFSASPSTTDVPFGTPSSFDERPHSIGAIPSGGNHQAVQDVSKMVASLVSNDHTGEL